MMRMITYTHKFKKFIWDNPQITCFFALFFLDLLLNMSVAEAAVPDLPDDYTEHLDKHNLASQESMTDNMQINILNNKLADANQKLDGLNNKSHLTPQEETTRRMLETEIKSTNDVLKSIRDQRAKHIITKWEQGSIIDSNYSGPSTQNAQTPNINESLNKDGKRLAEQETFSSNKK